jgi:RNA recognition motif-containing protein
MSDCLQAKAVATDHSAEALPRKLHVSKLTRNVSEEHVKEIFSTFGELASCSLAVDERVQLPKGYAVVEYVNREDAERAKELMDGGQLDGNVIQ